MAMRRFRARFWRGIGLSMLALGVALVLPLQVRAEGSKTGAVTFTKDVAPILQEKCQACHRPNYIAPMSLVTYEESRPWARAIKDRVVKRQMPPWHIDRAVGIQEFENDRSLSDDQIDTIVRWVDAGAPKGDSRDMPPPKQFANDDVWNFAARFGQPDLIIKSPPYTMPAQAPDTWYRPFVDAGLTEARWVRAIEIRPSTPAGRRITHHALAHLIQDDPDAPPIDTPAANTNLFDAAGLFMEWAVGKQGEVMRPDSGKLLLPGSKFMFDIHYHAVGEQITDSVELGIYFYPKGQEPKYRQTLASYSTIAGGADNIDIPPNSIWMSQNSHVMKKAGRVENYQPHMHLRGKAMLLEAVLPDGKTQVLSYVSNYNFNWHVNYVYTDQAAPLLPKGTVLRLTSWYDNTTANPHNPDPNQWVGHGDRTVDEMGHAWINITFMSDEEYEAELAKRKTPQATTASSQP